MVLMTLSTPAMGRVANYNAHAISALLVLSLPLFIYIPGPMKLSKTTFSER